METNNIKEMASETKLPLKKEKKNWTKSILTLILGIIVAHLGVAFFLLAELGSDPFTVFVDGLSKLIHSSVGTAHVLFLVTLMVIMLFTTKGYIKVGSVIFAFCGGPVIDFGIWAFGRFINADASIILRALSMVFGCITLALGIAITICSNAGAGPNDLISVIFADKLHKQLRCVRMAVDAIFVVTGFLLGGKIGVGTVVAVLLVGPSIQFWLKLTKKVLGEM